MDAPPGVERAVVDAVTAARARGHPEEPVKTRRILSAGPALCQHGHAILRATPPRTPGCRYNPWGPYRTPRLSMSDGIRRRGAGCTFTAAHRGGAEAAAELIAQSASAHARRVYASALNQLVAWLDGRRLDDARLAPYLGHLHRAGRAPAAAALAVAASRRAESQRWRGIAGQAAHPPRPQGLPPLGGLRRARPPPAGPRPPRPEVRRRAHHLPPAAPHRPPAWSRPRRPSAAASSTRDRGGALPRGDPPQ